MEIEFKLNICLLILISNPVHVCDETKFNYINFSQHDTEKLWKSIFPIKFD